MNLKTLHHIHLKILLRIYFDLNPRSAHLFNSFIVKNVLFSSVLHVQKLKPCGQSLSLSNQIC